MIPPKRLRRTLINMQECCEVFIIKYVSLFHKSSQNLRSAIVLQISCFCRAFPLFFFFSCAFILFCCLSTTGKNIITP